MPRRALALVAVAAMAASVAVAPAGAQGPGPPDHLRAFSIVPPGQEGGVTPLELATGDFGPHYDDQLEMYASLVDDDHVTGEELSTYFHPMQLGVAPGDTIERTYSPTGGVTVTRDGWGIPHIEADSFEEASFALGYVTAEDRMWQMDVFRHAARGTLSEFVGEDFLAMDIETRRQGYTEPEVQAMFDAFDDRFGADGVQIQEGLQAYADGVNAYILELKTTRIAERPVEYEATLNPFPIHPEEWSPLDTLFLVVLQLRVFGETAGFELRNARIYTHLVERLGQDLGASVFEDLLFQNEPRSPTSVPPEEGAFPSQRLGRPNPEAVAIPDDPEGAAASEARRAELREELLSFLGLSAPASNALLVAPSKSATGNTLHIGAPQVGYANPAFFMDVDVHAPGAIFRGPAVPGASVLVPLGRGPDYAWSLTTGVSDAVDVRAELLCEPDGSTPTTGSSHYLFQGACRPMESRTETFVVKPTATAPGVPRIEQRTFHRTVHGPVFDRGTVDGRPVAWTRERAFWMKELDSIPSFLRWNTQVSSVEDFAAAAEGFTMNFNALYADAESIGYFHVGHFPRRVRGVSPSLPSWGTGEWEWRGRFPFERHPQIIDPDRGWVANWNNKPSRGWRSFDGFKWGMANRVRILDERMNELLDGEGTATLADLVNVIRDAATRDVEAATLGPRMASWAGRPRAGVSDRAGQGAAIVEDWVSRGAHRRNRDRGPTMDDGPALALWDAWYRRLVHRVFDDELGEGFFGLPGAPRVSGYSPTGGSSFSFSFSDYLTRLFAGGGRGMSRDFCDDMTTPEVETCAGQVTAALEDAVAEVTAEQGQDMSAWTAPAENLAWQNQGAGSVPRIPWQNRGTHNHVVEILSKAGD